MPDSTLQIEAAVERRRLSSEQADALRTIQQALHEHSRLGWFIEQHCGEFREWERASEQRLVWTELHAEYVALVESQIEQQLSYLDAGCEDLYDLLADVVGSDERADSFLNRLLSMGDYNVFCDMMRWLGRIERRKFSTRL